LESRYPPAWGYFWLSFLQVGHVIFKNHPDVVTLVIVNPHNVLLVPFHQLRDASTWIVSPISPPSTP
jgi:hypothetical protein